MSCFGNSIIWIVVFRYNQNPSEYGWEEVEEIVLDRAREDRAEGLEEAHYMREDEREDYGENVGGGQGEESEDRVKESEEGAKEIEDGITGRKEDRELNPLLQREREEVVSLVVGPDLSRAMT